AAVAAAELEGPVERVEAWVSPMKALLDDGPHEPLFTPIVEPVQQPQQPVAPQQQYQQPQQPVPPQQQYQQPQ
ncbi:hypothetical protein ACUOFC_67550, partial [Escherichia sp. TWPC-MK]